MARMIPASFDRSMSPPGEEMVFRSLSNDTAAHDWTVLHSFDLPRHVKNVQGEIDFVVIIPGLGVVCLEVKSHLSVKRGDDGMWKLGSDPPDPRGPFKQAYEAAFSLIQDVQKRTPHFRSIPIFPAVCFPRCHFDVPATEWEEWQVIDQRALARQPLSYHLAAVLHNARAKFERQGKPRSKGTPTPDEAEALAKSLRPRFEVHQSPKARSKELSTELKRYTDEQAVVLDICDVNERVFIQGAAGTGKTLLAIEQARRFALGGHNVLLACFNKHLGSWLKSECQSEGHDITVSTVHSMMIEIADMDPPNEAPREFWEDALPDAALTSLLEGHAALERFDAVVLDEAQDILFPPFLEILELLVAGGAENGRWVLFGDLQKQAIYRHGGNNPNAVLNERFPTIARYPLYLNCRNTPRIGALIGQITANVSLYHGFRRRDDGVEPQIDVWNSQPDQVARLETALDRLRSESYRNEDISILSMVADTRSAGSRLGEPWISRIRPMELAGQGQGRRATAAAFKGLESPAVVLTDVTNVTSEWEESMLYVGMSRAIDRLVVLVSDEAREQLIRKVIGGGNDE